MISSILKFNQSEALEFSNAPVLHEYFPVIGIWVDDAVSEKLLSGDLNLHSFIRKIGSTLASKLPGWRYLNLNKKITGDDENLSKKSLDILQKYSDIFMTPEFMTNLQFNETNLLHYDKVKISNYSSSGFNNALPWYLDIFKVLSKSPRDTGLIFSDIPRFIIAFVEKPTNPKNFLENLPISFQNRLQNIEDITLPIYTAYNESISQLQLYESGMTHKVKLSQDNDELLETLTDILSDILTLKIPELTKKLIQVDKNNKHLQNKSSNILSNFFQFSNLFHSKPNSEEFYDEIFMLALNHITVKQFEEARVVILDLLTKTNYSRLTEVKICYIHIQLSMLAPLSEYINMITEIFTSELNFRQLYLMLLIVHSYSGTQVLLQSEFLLNKLILSFPCKHIIAQSILGFCYERMAVKSIAINRYNHAAFYFFLARRKFFKMNGNKMLVGHSYRCSVLSQHIISRYDDPTKLYRCGVSNTNILKYQDFGFTSCWEYLNSRALKLVAKDLDRCGFDQFNQIIYFYLLAHTSNQKLTVNVLKGMFNAFNKLVDKNQYNGISLPYFAIKNNVKVVKYGSAEYFKYDSGPYKAMINLWEKNTRTMRNVAVHWGIKRKIEIKPDIVVVNEPIVIRFNIINNKIPYCLNKTHLIVEESNINYVKESPQSKSLTKKVKSLKEPSFVKQKTDMKMPEFSQNSVENEIGKVSMKVIDIKPLSRDLEILPTKESQFTVDRMMFQFWETAVMTIPFPHLFMQSVKNQPTLFVIVNDNKEIQTSDGEVQNFKIRIANLGDAPVKKLFCMHDRPYTINMSNNTTIINDYAVIPIITESCINPGEEIVLDCISIGGRTGSICHITWFYEGNDSISWRHFVSRLCVSSRVLEDVSTSIFADPKDWQKDIIFAHVDHSSEVSIVGGKFHGKYFKKIEMDDIKSDSVNYENDKSSFYLEETPEDFNYEPWRDLLYDHNVHDGYVLLSVKNDQEKTEILKQFHVATLKCQYRFHVECAGSINFNENDTVDIKLTVRNVSDSVISNIKITTDASNREIMWVGKDTHYCQEIQPMSEEYFYFTAFFMNPGIHDVATFIVTDSSGNATHIPFKKYISVF